MWQLKNSNCYKTQIVTNTKTQIFTKLKMWQLKNSNCYKTQIVTNTKTEMVTKLKSNYDKTQLKLWQNSDPVSSISEKT